MSGFFEPSSIPREAMKFIEDSGFQLIFRDKLHLLSNHVTRGAKSRTSHYRHFDDLLEKMALTCKGLIGEKYMETVNEQECESNPRVYSGFYGGKLNYQYYM